jgi:hypothetical protein
MTTAIDVWFDYTPTATGLATATTCTPAGFAAGSLVDTVLDVFAPGPCPPSSSGFLDCNDDSCPGLSTTSFQVVSGSTYRIRASGFGAAAGTFYLSISVANIPAPSNDQCSSPIALVAGTNGPYTNIGASNSAVLASCSSSHSDVWFTVGGCVGLLTVDTCGSSFDTVLTVYPSCGGPELACNDDGWCGFQSSVSFTTTTTAPYLVRVATLGWSNINNGTFQINVTWHSGPGLHYSEPLGQGSLQIAAGGLPTSGAYLYSLTFGAGAFPSGWFFGIDIPITDLYNQYFSGWPFYAPLDSCGGFTIGPFVGLGALSGVTVYSVALGFPASGTPVVHTSPVSYTFP